MSETHDRLALELRMAVEALVGAPSPDAYNVLTKMLAALNRSGIRLAALETATATMNEICDRYERVGKIGLKDGEALALRCAAASIEATLPKLPVNVFARAVAEVEIYCASIGA
ncbi:hypothetical protein GCM10007387_57520 [Pseudoduganella albidiflava]|nr:hypothetical protein GCM10007387_57520 [Pseudoduganella albidiflava]